jgi:hypothetical protein
MRAEAYPEAQRDDCAADEARPASPTGSQEPESDCESLLVLQADEEVSGVSD